MKQFLGVNSFNCPWIHALFLHRNHRVHPKFPISVLGFERRRFPVRNSIVVESFVVGVYCVGGSESSVETFVFADGLVKSNLEKIHSQAEEHPKIPANFRKSWRSEHKGRFYFSRGTLYTEKNYKVKTMSISDSSEDTPFNGTEYTDDLEDYDMRRFDIHLQGPDETEERARLFQDIARRFRYRLDSDASSTARDQARIRGLQNCLYRAYGTVDGLRVEQNRDQSTIDYLAEVNTELAERVSGISSSYVDACLERDTHRAEVKKWKFVAAGAIGIASILIGLVFHLLPNFD